jgi:hypothetical protein
LAYLVTIMQILAHTVTEALSSHPMTYPSQK